MDENKNINGMGQENMNNPEKENNQDQMNSASQTGSGWVFSDKNVSGAKEESKKEEAFFHKEASEQPNEEGWYRSGAKAHEETTGNNGYNSRYSYDSGEPKHESYESAAGEPKASESYKWNYEDYNKEEKKPTGKNKKGRNKGLRIFTIILCAILCTGVIALAGYGTYALISDSRAEQAQEAEAEQQETQSEASAQLTLNDKPAGGANNAVNLAEGELTITQRAQKVQPSAVGIVAYVQSQQSIFGGSQSQGSGIIASKDGYIITNAHVVSGATSVKVVLYDNTEHNATIVGADDKSDIAVLKIEADNLTPAEFGNSDQLDIGEQVITVGNPGGLELAGSITVGYVSALNRPITTKTGNTIDCIQTDAAINPGNSGGALVNTYGQVIGINSQKIAATDFEGIGFAISINEAQPIINDLIEHGYVTGRVKMGITMTVIDQTSAQLYGYKPGIGVVSVDENSAADKAGLVPGDIITEIDGENVLSNRQLAVILEKHKPGDEITLTVFRQTRQAYGQGQEVQVKLVLEEAGAPESVQSNAQQQSPSKNAQGSQSGQSGQRGGALWSRGN